jgi:ATP-binding cassette subfamily A (ABC1) protein 1
MVSVANNDLNEADDTPAHHKFNKLKTPEDVKIHEFIKARISNAALTENIGCEMTYAISNKPEYTKTYKDFFHDFEINMDRLGIDTIGISDTTLEEIFIKLAKQPEPIKANAKSKCYCCHCQWSGSNATMFDSIRQFLGLKQEQRSLNMSTIESTVDNDAKSEPLVITDGLLETYSKYTSSRVDSTLELLGQQLKSLLVKRFYRFKRNLKGFFAEIVLPVVFVIFALLVATLIPGIESRPPIELHPWHYGESTNIFHSKGDNMPNLRGTSSTPFARFADDLVETFYLKPSLGTRCMPNHKINFTKNYDYSRTVKTNYVLECVDNALVATNDTTTTGNIPIGLQMALGQTNFTNTKISPVCSCQTGFPTCPVGAGGDIDYRNVRKLHTTDTMYDLTDRNTTDWILKTEFEPRFFRKRFGGFEFLEPILNTTLANNLNRLLAITIGTFNNDTAATTTDVLGAFLANDRIKVWYNNKGYIAAVSFLNVINNAILRTKVKRANPNATLSEYGIVAINHPMDFTTGDLANQLLLQLFIDLFVAICIIFALSFIPASFLVFLLEERENNSKQLQFVSGVKPYIYWLSNFLWDLINYCIPCILCILIFLIFDVKTYISKENFPCLCCLLLLYGWAIIPMMYPLNYMFQIPSTAFVSCSSLNVLIGVVSTMSTTILEQLGNEEPELYEISKILKPIFICLFPHYCLGRGFLDMSVLYNTARAERSLGISSSFSPFEFDKVGKNMIALGVQGLVFFSLNLLIEYNFFVRFKPTKQLPEYTEPRNEDDDVRAERMRICNVDANENTSKKEDYIRLENLSKVYQKLSKCAFKRHTAVKSLCLGIDKGECFGLIGVNGAGIST